MEKSTFAALMGKMWLSCPLSPLKISCKMSHINQEQRYAIFQMLKQGKSQKEIAEFIGKDKSVISRELRRNCDKRNNTYDYEMAQRKYEMRKKNKPKKKALTGAILTHVEARLEADLSPEQIAGEAKLHGIACVSHETIYKHIWKNKKQGGNLYLHLRRHGKRYRKRGCKRDNRGIITGRIDISQRPKVVEKKKRFGDFEIDTVIGKNHQGALVTINDRATGLVKIRKVPTKEAELVAKVTIKALKEYKNFIHTITADNGKEFAQHAKISKALSVGFYFAKPYHSWERGANENTNGLIRQYFPKKTDFSTITDEQVQEVENKLNNRPRKRLGYLSPIAIFEKSKKVAFVA